MSEWFEDWFESDEYLEVYKHRNFQDAENLVSLILNVWNIKINSSILDLACGAGRHSIIFAKKGFDVTGVDLSRKLLSIAKENCRNENLKIDFIRGDLRNFLTAKKFDLITNLFTSFGYFINDDDNYRIFQSAKEHLKNNGFFVFDYFNKQFLEKNLNSNSSENWNDLIINQNRKIIGKRIVKQISITKNNHTKEFIESVRLFSSTELLEKLNEFGFTILKTFGNYKGEEFDINNSERFIVFCQNISNKKNN